MSMHIVRSLRPAPIPTMALPQVQSRYFVFCEIPAYLDGKGGAAALQNIVRQEDQFVERAGLLRS
jgi:hypothetical protein